MRQYWGKALIPGVHYSPVPADDTIEFSYLAASSVAKAVPLAIR